MEPRAQLRNLVCSSIRRRHFLLSVIIKKFSFLPGKESAPGDDVTPSMLQFVRGRCAGRAQAGGGSTW